MKRSLSHGGGYLQIDHRDSPGIRPEDVPAGTPAISVTAGKNFEADSYACSHCQRQVLKNPERKRERAVCPKCYHVICDLCAGVYAQTGVCNPVRKQFDKAQEQAEKFKGQPDHPEAKIILTDA